MISISNGKIGCLLVMFMLLPLTQKSMFAQGANTVTIRFNGTPTGSCSPIAYAVDNLTGNFYDCNNGSWVLIGGGSGSSGTTFNIKSYGAKVDEIRNFDGAMPVIGSNGHSTTSATPAWTTNFSNEQVLAIFNETAAVFSSPPSVGTNLINVNWTSGLGYGMFVNYQTVTSPGSVSAITGTFAASQFWDTGTVALVPTSGNSVSFRTPATSHPGATGTLTINVPTGTSNGDLLIACVNWFNHSNTLTTPAAFTPLFWQTDGNNNALYCFSRTASSEPASYNWTQTAATDGISGFMLAATNVAYVDDALTSASANFVAGDVGKDICIATINSIGGQSCGTVDAVVSSTVLIPSVTNVGSNSSSLPYRYGTDDSTAIASTFSAAAAAGGGTVFIPPGGTMITQAITWPTTAPVNLEGAGSAVSNALTRSPNVNNTLNGSEIDVATTSLAIPFITLQYTNSNLGQVYQSQIANLSIWAGAGIGRDGGGQGGLDLLNISHFTLRNLLIGNFLGDNIFVGTSATGATFYVQNLSVYGIWSLNSGANGMELGSNGMQNVLVENSEFDLNTEAGFYTSGSGIVSAIKFVSDLFQVNGGTYEFNMDSGVVLNGCSFDSNYFEKGGGSATTTMPLRRGLTGCDFRNNHVTSDLTATRIAFSAAGTAIEPASSIYAHQPPVMVLDTTACTAGTEYDTDTGGSVACFVQSDGTHWWETGQRAF